MPVVGGTSSDQRKVGSAVVGKLDAEVLDVPGVEGFGVARSEEDAAYSGDSGHSGVSFKVLVVGCYLAGQSLRPVSAMEAMSHLPLVRTRLKRSVPQ